jgi:hypothetical protein
MSSSFQANIMYLGMEISYSDLANNHIKAIAIRGAKGLSPNSNKELITKR